MSNSVYSTTTRLTSPEPTGFAKTAQDHWDNHRETQVRTYERRKCDDAFNGFCVGVRKGADKLMESPVSGSSNSTMTCVMGSYDIIDEKNMEKFVKKMEKLQKRDKSFTTTPYLKERNIVIGAGGIRTTGTVHFTDGSFEVVDPTKGIQLGGSDGRTLKTIKKIYTPYVYLIRLPADVIAEVDKQM